MHFDATFWVGLAFVVFVGVLLYYGVHRKLIQGLDARAESIRSEIDEARKLREEAQALLASYERKQRDALAEAEGMVANAREEAAREARIAGEKLETALQRREQLALEKVRFAEAQAEREVREAAVQVAVAAATEVIRQQLKGERGAALIDDSIKTLRAKLN